MGLSVTYLKVNQKYLRYRVLIYWYPVGDMSFADKIQISARPFIVEEKSKEKNKKTKNKLGKISLRGPMFCEEKGLRTSDHVIYRGDSWDDTKIFVKNFIRLFKKELNEFISTRNLLLKSKPEDEEVKIEELGTPGGILIRYDLDSPYYKPICHGKVIWNYDKNDLVFKDYPFILEGDVYELGPGFLGIEKSGEVDSCREAQFYGNDWKEVKEKVVSFITYIKAGISAASIQNKEENLEKPKDFDLKLSLDPTYPLEIKELVPPKNLRYEDLYDCVRDDDAFGVYYPPFLTEVE